MSTQTPRTERELLSSDCAYNCGHSFNYLRCDKYENGKCISVGPEVAHGNDGIVVLADFARQLEKENARLRDALHGLIAQCKTGDDITAWWRAAVEQAELALSRTDSPPAQ